MEGVRKETLICHHCVFIVSLIKRVELGAAGSITKERYLKRAIARHASRSRTHTHTHTHTHTQTHTHTVK